jgi:hypothetical protein
VVSRRVWALVGLFAVLLVGIGLWSMRAPVAVESAERAPGGGELGARADAPNPGERPVLGSRTVLMPEGARVPLAQLRVRERLASGALREAGGAAGGFTLDEKGISAAVLSRQSELDACWRAARAHDPTIAAARTLQFEVVPQSGGTATVSWVNSGAELLDSCLENAFAGVKFAATEPSTLRYPITFR